MWPECNVRELSEDIDLVTLAAQQQKMPSSARQDSKFQLSCWQQLPLLYASLGILLGDTCSVTPLECGPTAGAQGKGSSGLKLKEFGGF